MIIRQSVKDLRVMGRNTQGVRLIRLNEDDSIADIARVISEDDEAPETANGKESVEVEEALDI